MFQSSLLAMHATAISNLDSPNALAGSHATGSDLKLVCVCDVEIVKSSDVFPPSYVK